ncbi:hypothetical protein PAAG_03861 [Paracoccidioides lutzii Pb01]|uniref:Uncharacterized protein n=1 Tax=Paracoccidioides lutzii (strain ATCC MYA-826 / Pb01) TaxID=502779 RepID=C1GZB7_PARBA|nr:hypothetical protein PAAG_03861 [Paracoccidioides lutzii Pb01]EEH41940.2 hypothetical protein PAAG_03861 [Paracoccidioides lutzii Pb01]
MAIISLIFRQYGEKCHHPVAIIQNSATDYTRRRPWLTIKEADDDPPSLTSSGSTFGLRGCFKRVSALPIAMVVRKYLLLTTVAALCLLPTALVEFQNMTANNYQLKATSYSSIIANLGKVLTVISVIQVLAKFNHRNPNLLPRLKHPQCLYLGGHRRLQRCQYREMASPVHYHFCGHNRQQGRYRYEGDVATLVSGDLDRSDGDTRGARISFINRNKGVTKGFCNILHVEQTDSGRKPDFEAFSGSMQVWKSLLNPGDGIGHVGYSYQAHNES